MAKEEDELIEETGSIKLLWGCSDYGRRLGILRATLLGISEATMSEILLKGLSKGVAKGSALSGAEAA